MLTLRPSSVAYNLQMDWSFNPDDENKSKREDNPTNQYQATYHGLRPQNAGEVQPISAQAAVARHFEESFRRFSQLQNTPRSNGHRSESRSHERLPPAQYNNVDPNPPLLPQRPFQHLGSSNGLQYNSGSNYQTGAVNDNVGPSRSFTRTITQRKAFTRTLTTRTTSSTDTTHPSEPPHPIHSSTTRHGAGSATTRQRRVQSAHCTTSTYVPGSSTLSESRAQMAHPTTSTFASSSSAVSESGVPLTHSTASSYVSGLPKVSQRKVQSSHSSTSRYVPFPSAAPQPAHTTTSSYARNPSGVGQPGFTHYVAGSSTPPQPAHSSTSRYVPNPLGAPPHRTQPPSVAGPYDVDSISSILRSYQHNSFINSSILKDEIKDEIKEEPPDAAQVSYNGNRIRQNGSNGVGRSLGILKVKIKKEDDFMKHRKKEGGNVLKREIKVEKREHYLVPTVVGTIEIKDEDVEVKKEDEPEPYSVPTVVGMVKIKEEEVEIKKEDEPEPYSVPTVVGIVEIKEEEVEIKKEDEPEPYSVPTVVGIVEIKEEVEVKEEEAQPGLGAIEIKEEKPEPSTVQSNGAHLEIKEEFDREEEHEPTTVPTMVDIEAELPSTSIKQRPPPKPRRKPANSRKNGAAKVPKPVRVGKEGSKRTSKRATNYCEDSSDEELKAALICANRSFLPIKMDFDATVSITQPMELMEIKTEPDVEIKMEVDEGHQLEPKSDNTQVEIKDEIKDEPMSPSASPVQSKGDQASKPKVVRNPAAAARNRGKLNPLTRKEQMMMNKLMESKEPFLQNLPCLKISSRISKCRECRCSSLRSDSAFCRFYDFRRLRFKDKSVLVVEGFSDPNKDPGPSDIALWMPGPPPGDIDLDVSRFILMHVGDQFCRIWQEEQAAVKEHMSSDTTIAWKKVVKGVREICDVCETTLFNYHWTCSKCGFGVCIDCYLDRKRKLAKKIERPTRGFDDYGWLVCTFREAHEQNTLMLTQIIPGNSLNVLAQRFHEICRLWKIPQKCCCPLMASVKEQPPKFSEISDKIMRDTYVRFFSRECEAKYHDKIKELNPEEDYMEIAEAETELIEETAVAGTLPLVLATTLKHLKYKPKAGGISGIITIDQAQDAVTKEYNALESGQTKHRYLPQKVMTLRISQQMFPGIDHDWLCSGKLLRLLDPRNKRNPLLFQEVWKRGQPVMVSELCKFLNLGLWHPEAFCRDFGEKKNDLINCMTGNLVPNQPMKHFWEGFLSVGKRLLDADREPMLLKLKDWPPGDDFAEILPTRFADLMSALPLPEYTLRSGTLNIASRLPNIFVPPDLGPKMYNAYGSALHPDKGTTNLHLDISDAVNIMVYVGIPTDASAQAQIDAAMRAIDGGGCDIITRRRVRMKTVMPGALWHIYSARDADKIRDLLNRVTIEKGFRLEPDHDPIHDQNWYLDNELRTRLYDDYGVEGYPIVQCLGDAVFIPAGAPHQVRNLHNCIKVAEDFVSPENIQHCFHLSQQFRKLSMSHTNHEDKLQIRNVIYHAVKDTTAYLTHLLNWKL